MSPTSSPAGKPAGARPSGPPPPPSARRWVPLLLVLTGLAGVEYVMARRSHEAEISYSEFYRDVGAGEVASVVFDGRDVTGHFTKPKTASGRSVSAFETSLPEVEDPGLLALLRDKGVDVKAYRDQDPLVVRVLAPLLPWVIIIGAWVWLSRRTQSMMSSGGPFAGLTRGKAKRFDLEPHVRVTFQDVAGLAPAKRDLQEIVDFLRDSERFRKLGGHIPRGVLLVGPPGTGKTLLARAVAGEAGAPFFSVNGSEFIELFVGVGAARVRELFDEAKKVAPAIIFIDEIDAVGRSRGAGLGGGNDEREQTLNQLLSAMDGFSRNDMIIVLAATNRPDVLDAALLRPGRFDRRVLVDRPELTARQAILGVHLRGKPLAADVDLKKIAATTPGFSGADLENLVNEAALLAARKGANSVEQQCFWEALEKIQLGAERPLVLTAEDRKIVAYHEGGHAMVALLSPNADPLNRVTIVPRGHALGVTLQLPIDDRYNYSKSYLLTRIAVALGGRIAEELVFGDITTGAENDLDMVANIVRQMVTRWGMDPNVGVLVQAERMDQDLGGLLRGKEVSEYMAKQIDTAMQAIVNERYQYTRKLLSSNLDKLHKLASLLLEHESVDAEYIRRELGLTEEQVQLPAAAVKAAFTSRKPGA